MPSVDIRDIQRLAMTDKIWVCKDCGMRPTYFPDAIPVCNHCDSDNVEEILDPGPLIHIFSQDGPHDEAYIHIFSQDGPHDEAYIVANYNALRQLQLVIEEALSSGQGKRELYCNDGEGFNLYILCRELDWDQRAVPYTDPASDEKRKDALYPWKEAKERRSKP